MQETALNERAPQLAELTLVVLRRIDLISELLRLAIAMRTKLLLADWLPPRCSWPRSG